MAERLVKVAKELNLGLSTIVDFLALKGYVIENKPTTQISDEMHSVLLKEYSSSMIVKNTMSKNDPHGLAHAKKLIAENLETKETFLDLGNCGLRDLTELPELWECQHLEGLNMGEYIWEGENSNKSKNTFKYNEIGDEGAKDIAENLTSLTSLDLGSNQIGDEGAKGIAKKIESIKYLNLSKNKITTIFPFLKILENNQKLELITDNVDSKGLNLFGNPIVEPPKEIVSHGRESILEYFRQKELSGSKLLLEAKMVLLGDSRAGKSSLAYRLLNKKMPKEEDRTKGVDIVIGEYTFPEEGGQFSLNIWDFAGQDKYKTIHQFFYTESTLYVMVADSGNANTDFADWFETVNLYGEGSPLIVVLNEFSDGVGYGTFAEEHWKSQFPSLIKEVHLVNLLKQKDISLLERDIRHYARQLPHVQYEFPNNWANIRAELEKRRDENFISIQEYLRICKENNLPERNSALILSSVLHKIGICFHYQKSELLSQYIILKNEWATSALYRILEDHTIAEVKKGYFNVEDLRRIWSDTEYNDMIPQLLELMCEFKLAYPLHVKNEYVASPLLPQAQPRDIEIPETNAIQVMLEFEFLPKAFMTQFIVSRHKDIDHDRNVVWRDGVVLQWPSYTLAIVRKTKSRGKDAIQVLVNGTEQRSLLTSITKTLRDLCNEYKGIRVQEIVKCPCEGCRTAKNEQHFFDFKNLTQRLEKGRRTVECDKSLEEVDLLKLLGGLFIFEQINIGQKVELKDDFTPLKLIQENLRTKNPFLDLGNCNINDLSEISTLWECTHLNELNLGKWYRVNGKIILSKNPLKPNNIGDNGIQLIIENFKNLSSLSLVDNQIGNQGIIALAKNLGKLTSLDLGVNKIGDEGAIAIGENLKELVYLNIMTNTLSDEGVKSIVLNLPKLLYVDFLDNNIKQIPPGILDNLESIKNWFESKRVRNNTIKMILLGNTRAGKSELAHILKENQNKPDDKRTLGIEHWLWEEKLSNNQTLRINIYDFGGQDYYHATHHLFFTHNTLYVILWHQDLNDSLYKEEGQHFDLGFWLGNIKYLLLGKLEQSQINDSTAFWLLQNKGDLVEVNQKTFPNSQLCNSYNVDPNGVFYLSLLKFKDQKSGWNSEYKYFRRHLVRKLSKLAGDIEITEIWATIKDEVLPSFQNRGYFIVDHEYFFDECNAFLGVRQGTKDDYKASLTYLNGSGEIIIFDEIESLKDKVILDPKRLMKIMYTILTKQAANNEGIIELSNNHEIQKDENINREVYNWVIDILKFYDIIFPHPIQTDKYVAPQYLSESPYQDILNDLLPASLTIKYNDFIPMAVMGKFISQYLKNDQDAKYWKYGAIFYKGNCYCMVRMDRASKKVYIHVEERKVELSNPSISMSKSSLQTKELKNNLLREFLEFFTGQIKSKIDLTANQKGTQVQERVYIQGIELSNNELDFFSIEMMVKDLDHCRGYLPNSVGSYQQVPAIFYFLLNKQSKAPKTIFVCYSHSDVLHRDELDKHLAALKLQGKVDTFHDGKILPGQKWDEVIKSNLYNSDIVLLLLSVDFMNSIYIWETELKIAKDEGKSIIPVFLRHCDFAGTGIEKDQGVPFFNDKDKSRGIAWIMSDNFKSIDEAFLKVVERIKTAL